MAGMTCDPMPPLSAGREALVEWLTNQMPTEGDRYSDAIVRMGHAFASIVGASFDLLLQLQFELERLRDRDQKIGGS